MSLRAAWGALACSALVACATPAEEALRLELARDEFTLRVLVLGPDGQALTPEADEAALGASSAAGAYRLQVIPQGTQSIELRLENGPSQSPSLLTAPRVVLFNTSGALGPRSFTRLRPGQYRLSARAFSGTNGAGGQLGDKSLVQSYAGGGTTNVTLRLRLTALGGRVAF